MSERSTVNSGAEGEIRRGIVYVDPGATIRKYMNRKGMDERVLSLQSNIDKDLLGRLLSNEEQISDFHAYRLSLVLGESPEFWRQLQRSYSEDDDVPVFPASISNVPRENVMEGMNYDGSVLDSNVREGKVKIVQDLGPDTLFSPDGVFSLTVNCEDAVLREQVKDQLRYFLNDPQRATNFLPKIKNAIERRNVANASIPKRL